MKYKSAYLDIQNLKHGVISLHSYIHYLYCEYATKEMCSLFKDCHSCEDNNPLFDVYLDEFDLRDCIVYAEL